MDQRRLRGRPFQPGQSGNPGGRPPSPLAHLQKLYGPDGHILIDEIRAFSDNPRAPIKVRLQAKQYLMDRGWGKATQSLDVDGHLDVRAVDVSSLSDAELVARAKALIEELEHPRALTDASTSGLQSPVPFRPALPHSS